MKKILITVALGLALAATPVLAHHPAADMVDAEIYAMIDELVSDTPHATMVFDDTMGAETTTITVPSVSDAEDIIDGYLLAAISLLDEDVTVSITFGEEVSVEEARSSASTESSKWTERDDWGRQVIITVNTLLCDPDIPDGCKDIN